MMVRQHWAVGALVPNCIYNNNKLVKLFQIMKVFGHLMIRLVVRGRRHGVPNFHSEAKMLRTMQELQELFRETINTFNWIEKEKKERRLSEEFFEIWKSKAVKEEGETNVRCLRFTFKNEFDLFCDKEIESIKMFCRESKLEILIS